MSLGDAAQAQATLDALRGIVRRIVAISSLDVYRAMAVLHRLDSGPIEPNRRPAILMEDAQACCVLCRGYVGNVADAIAWAATSEAAAGRVYNVAEPDRVTEAAWTERLGVISGWHGRVITLPPNLLPQHLRLPYNFEQHLFTDSTKIRSELGYREIVSAGLAIRRTIDWERADPPERIDPSQYDYSAEDEAIRGAAD